MSRLETRSARGLYRKGGSAVEFLEPKSNVYNVMYTVHVSTSCTPVDP